MDYWVKKAFMEQHKDRMLQEAAKQRMLGGIREHRDDQSSPVESEARQMLKRRLAYAVSIAILVVLWLTQVVQAAGGGGGGGGYLVM